MDVNRKIINRLNINDDKDDGYVQVDMAELISLMWEITEDTWSFVRNQNAEQRLQRNVAVLVRNKATGREKDKLDAQVLMQRRKTLHNN